MTLGLFADEPIIQSLLDTDTYQTTMANMLHNAGHGCVPVRYAFTNRSRGIRLADEIPIEVLREQLDHARTLRYTPEEIAFERAQRRDDGSTLYSKSYLNTLSDYQLPEIDICVAEGHQYKLVLPESGWNWVDGLRWETFFLSIVSELRVKALAKRHGITEETLIREGEHRFLDKRKILKAAKGLPGLEQGVPFMEFGTRRRPFRKWQEHVIEMLIEYNDAYRFLGTSNEYLAMKYGLKPMGTNSHQGPMGYSALFPDTEEGLRDSQMAFLDDWYDCYGRNLAVCLPDTFGTPFCLDLMTVEQARSWKGFRQDSGSPDICARRILDFYARHGVDPKTKMIIFSDGLNVNELVRLVSTYAPMFGTVSGGWGTDLIFDFGDAIPIHPGSFVVKLVRANGRDLAKLSDNPEKATGPRDRVEHLLKLTRYETLEENRIKVVV